jgi:hypothetical protein
VNKTLKSSLGIAFLVAAAFVGAELLARYRFGLGSPPLYVSDPLTEYRFKPNQHLKRFGNAIDVNAYSMRSSALAPARQPGTRRILVFGDSVVWGGAVLDQSLIATQRLKGLLPGEQGSPQKLEVGNVAAPSWGPGNQLGWARRFGFLQATDVVLVISSHDAFDNPSPEPFRGDLNHPLVAPATALSEGFERYLLPRLGLSRPVAPTHADNPKALAEPTTAADPRVQQALEDLRQFLVLARSSGARVVAVQFADRQEASNGQFQPGNGWIHQLLQQQRVPSVQAGPLFRACGPMSSLYSDPIHPYTPAGQACLAKAIAKALTL